MTNLKIEKFASAHLDAQIELGSSAYSLPEVTDREHFGWKHLANPYGASLCISVGKDDGMLTGRAFVLPRTFWLSSSVSKRGALVTDLVVRPGYRSAATTVEITRAMKSPQGVDIVVHTSNGTSDIIYRKLFKFPIAFTLAACGLPISVHGAIRRSARVGRLAKPADLLVSPWRWLLKAARLTSTRWSGLRFDVEPSVAAKHEVFAAHRQRAGAHFERSTEFLDWRFSRGPIFNADIKWIWRNDDCLGYVALKQVDVNGLSVMVILDIVLKAPPRPIDAVTLKLMAVNEAINSSADAVFTLLNMKNPDLRWLFSFPFFHVQDRHLPHPTPIFVHCSSGGASAEQFDDMFFTLADLDYF